VLTTAEAAPVETSPDGLKRQRREEADCSWEVAVQPLGDDPTAVQRKRDTRPGPPPDATNWSKIHEPLTRSFIASHQLRRDAAHSNSALQRPRGCQTYQAARLRAANRITAGLFTAEGRACSLRHGAAALRSYLFVWTRPGALVLTWRRVVDPGV
jgi:hypothetical protein